MRIPTGLLCLLKYAEANKPDSPRLDISIRLFRPEEAPEEIAGKLEAEQADLIGFSCYVWNITRSMSTAKLLSGSGAKLLVGGLESECAGELMSKNPFIDFCARGDGEEILLGLMIALAEGKKPPRINGLVARAENGLDDPGGHGNIKDINTLPRIFTEELVNSLPEGTRIIYTSERGCFCECRYCTWKSSFRRLRIETVEKEIETILSSDKIVEISIADSDCSYDLRRTKRIISTIEKHNARRIPILMFFSFLNTDSEILDMIRRNDIGLMTGVQSANPNTLHLANRDLYLDRNAIGNIENSIGALNPGRVSISFINGLPGDNFETISESARWAQSLGCASLTFFDLLALPGSYFREHAGEFGIRHKAEPFYNVTETASFSAADIEKTRSRSFWLQVLYPLFRSDALSKLAKENVFLWDIAGLLPFMGADGINKYAIPSESGLIFLKPRHIHSLTMFALKTLENLSGTRSDIRSAYEYAAPQFQDEAASSTIAELMGNDVDLWETIANQ